MHLSVTRTCQLLEKNCHISNMYKNSEKSCKVIVVVASMHAIVSKLITTLGIKSVKHPNSYKVTWIDAISIDVQERCQISIQFVTYTNYVWCDILLMDVGHIILG